MAAPAEDAAADAVDQLSLEYNPSNRLGFYQKRIALFEQFYEREQQRVEEARKAAVPIKVVLPDGAIKEAIKGATTPLDVANEISKSLGKKVLVATVDGEVWDAFRPLEADCALQLLTWDEPDGKETFWHSSAHVLGEALEMEFGVDLTIGPALEEGFYYDCYMGDKTLAEAERPSIEKRMEAAVKEGQRFQRVVVSRAEALSMFTENKFKADGSLIDAGKPWAGIQVLDRFMAAGALAGAVTWCEIIQGLPEDATISLYRCGPMAVAVTNASRAFWRADVNKEPLQRVYAITFPDKALLKDYQHRMEEAKKRDHRNVGVQQELFFFHQLSPGSAFFQPCGARVYNALVAMIREKYWEYEYEEVVTPNVFNFDLWHTSGHADHYRENMFSFDVEKAEFGLKPMNCPGHCVMFANRARSYRELPLRYAEWGVLHRNEYSGALSGLTRVRRFVQDDAHIFCRPDQVMAEVQSFLKMLGEVYGTFGLDYSMALSTRPEGYLGELATWDKAEAALTEALNSTGLQWTINEADGAFYGPKIDITVYDALRRKFQCATVQLDFQMPIRFNLSYATDSGSERPVIVHRAVLGSVERMYAILTEHYAGKWPLWLSPRQVMIVPISEKVYAYADQIRSKCRKAGLFADSDASDRKMQKKASTRVALSPN
ncbi:threonyl-tRNA synthetase [Monoraphidium neglectum]|uniref:threonine--tRNA ligase n=1 Tax=Monoraphidium neglectum TaxID=145388 RepID=A0A0D2KYD7_9CHLO|nr:threonyl-tRNA synthetase [Monoraphidium neglectum]KIZ00239.1 threonyl-tRNA synthetase [Monoraphidium neglectum]|eukprot:XP_013899258.1 threonyl-tRNA synthetase [Monoraphidium neglectum]